MTIDTAEVKELLITRNHEFKSLYEKHQSYEKRLSQLSKRNFLTSEEEREVTELKKRKLNLKDRMQMFIEEYLSGTE